jgi:hypothetical protein
MVKDCPGRNVNIGAREAGTANVIVTESAVSSETSLTTSG